MQLAFRFGAGTAGLEQARDAGSPDRAGSVDIVLPNPVLAGGGREIWAEALERVPGRGAFTLWREGGRRWGAAFPAIGARGFAGAADDAYRDLFRAAEGLSLYRIWNFLPGINESADGLENYRAFCQGRHSAFTACFGRDSEQRMPAASAVGTGGDRLGIVFVAGPSPVRYVENPHQVPAYRYPSRYGPRAPSFARAAVVHEPGERRLYVSGTASIRGSESCHEGNVDLQLHLALDNLDAVARAAGYPALDTGSAGQRSFRLYLRRADDWPGIRDVLQHRLLREGDTLSVVQADICRRELLVEIEGCVTG